MRKIRSRILEIFDKDILIEMYKLQSKRFTNRMFKGKKTRMEYSASMKVKDMTKLLSDYLEKKGVSYSFPGAGTNRMTVLINGYIYKIALDQDGYIDNLNEFIVSKEAQPYVTKTYETNGLLAVAEYVTLISYEEFVEKKSKILEILDDISREYLIGDMGWTQKNYTNWGYRKNSDDLVILDFGHMHRLSGEKLLCRECGQILQYNSTFTKLKCLSCGKEEEFMAIKSRLSKKEERQNIDNYLERAYVLTEPCIEIKEDEVKDMSMYETVADEELVSTRFKRFAPKKGKYDHLLEERRVVEAENITSLESLHEDVSEKVYEDYLKVVQGKIRIRKPIVQESEPKEILDPIKEEIVEMDELEAQEYIYSLFIKDEINREQYEFYIDYIENGEEEEEIENNESEVVLDVKNTNKPEDNIMYDEDSDKVFVFGDDDLGIDSSGVNAAEVMLSMIPKKKDNIESIKSVDSELEEGSFTEFMNNFKDFCDTGDEEFDDDEVLNFEMEDNEEEYIDAEIIDIESTDIIEEEPCSLKVKESGTDEVVEIKAHQLTLDTGNEDVKVEEVEMKVKLLESEKPTWLSPEEVSKAKVEMSNTEDEEVGLKVISNTDEKIYKDKQRDNNSEISLKIKETSEPASEIKMDVSENDNVGIKMIENDKFNNEEIFLKMRSIQQQRQEELQEEKDYSHYEDEYAHLMEEDEYSSRGNRRNNWK
ncbi:hypothetical protein [Romboutsia ilealis]|uniref:hypothetical protein n=1 Tax=Romboutsia ilealis TaxID=1115758 RepID=UPI00272D2AB7|nr:hypothetical protein [Romboutsia ilealis]